jgi:hypothetical protein
MNGLRKINAKMLQSTSQVVTDALGKIQKKLWSELKRKYFKILVFSANYFSLLNNAVRISYFVLIDVYHFNVKIMNIIFYRGYSYLSHQNITNLQSKFHCDVQVVKSINFIV